MLIILINYLYNDFIIIIQYIVIKLISIDFIINLF